MRLEKESTQSQLLFLRTVQDRNNSSRRGQCAQGQHTWLVEQLRTQAHSFGVRHREMSPAVLIEFFAVSFGHARQTKK